MAQATAHCVCKYCGAEFVKYKDCHNRTEANSWEEWAEENIDTCPNCYYKRLAERKKSSPLEVQIHLGEITSDGVEALICVTSDNSYERKDELKQAGFQWRNVTRAYRTVWTYAVYICDKAEYKEKMRAALHELQAELGKFSSKYRMFQSSAFVAALNIYQQNKEALQNLGEYPQYPENIKELLRKGRWNGKIYGKAGSYRIFLSSKEYRLTDEQAQLIRGTDEARATWTETKKRLTTIQEGS